MPIFAAGLGGLIEIVIFLVIVGIAAINKVLAARREQEPPMPVPPRQPQRRPLQTAQAGMNPMETNDVDQFLDEVLGRGARRPVPPVPEKPVVILRPTNVPAGQQAPIRPPRTPIVRPAARPVRRTGAAPAPPPLEPKVRSKFSETVQKDVDEAAAATQVANLTQKGVQSPMARQRSAANDVLGMLRSPSDIRRAILIREILGPPVALRRRRLQ
jgi:hypothetical protein